MDEGTGVGEGGPEGWAGVRLCNLAAQGSLTAQGFKLYKSQIPVIEQAMETAALMLGTDKSRGYCLEMIWADFLAGASLENEDPSLVLQSMSRFLKFLPGEQRQAFLHEVTEKAS
jgi:hypothetical protein